MYEFGTLIRQIGTLLFYLVALIMLACTIYLHRWFKWNKHVVGMAKAWASSQGLKSGEARRERVRKRTSDDAKAKIIDAVSKQFPLGQQLIKGLRAEGITDNELFAMAQDKEVMSGIMAIVEGVGGAAKWLGGLSEKAEKTISKGRKQRKSSIVSLK